MDTNDRINRMLGNGKGQGVGLPRQGLGFGRTQGPGVGFKKTNVITQIQNILNKLPEVKKAKGTLTVDFADGQKSTFQISYTE